MISFSSIIIIVIIFIFIFIITNIIIFLKKNVINYLFNLFFYNYLIQFILCLDKFLNIKI